MYESFDVPLDFEDGSLGKSGEKGSGLRSVCVFSGASAGVNSAYGAAGAAIGVAFARAGVRLVYGGGGDGLTGVMARAALSAGGRVTGVIPHFMRQRTKMLEMEHELVFVADMHSREREMCERADAFVALPGGFGTLGELVEQMTMVKLKRHAKPVLIVDIEGFWQPFLALQRH
jgi:uncharacterized protein (TIGR00730 family)